MTHRAWTCHYCGRKRHHKTITRDHVIARSRGGQDAAENLVPSCYRCNQNKADSDPVCECKVCVTAYQFHRDLIEYRRSISPGWAEANIAILGPNLTDFIYALTQPTRYELLAQEWTV